MQLNSKPCVRKARALTSALLAVSMMLTSMQFAMAAESNTATKTDQVTSTSSTSPIFSDVKLGYWAEKHIHKLAALDILKGNNGKFRPGDDVTQQEAITMAIRYMGLEGELNAADSVALPADFKVGNYFKPYIVLAFQKGLLDKKEEMANPDPKQAWGDQKATREWVTKILVRAVGKQADAERAANKKTTFADNSKISAAALGYVNTAVDLELTTGMSGNKFEPQGKVTRAQLATFFSRGEKVSKVKHTSESFGYVMSQTDQEIRLYTEEGKTANFRRDKNTMYYKTDSEQAIKVSDIGLYMKVRVVGQSGSATYVELIDAEPKVETSTVKLRYVAPSEKKLYFTKDGSDALSDIVYDNSATVFKDASGNTIDSSKLMADSELVIKRETFTNERKIIEVQVKSGPVNKSAKGTITSIDVRNRSVTIKNEQGESETYTVVEGAYVRYKDQLLSGLSSIKENDSVNYTVKNSVVTEIELTNAQQVTISGTLYEKGATKTSITIRKENNELVAKLLARDVKIEIDGMNNPTFDDIVAGEYGDRVELAMNSEDQVANIKVMNRKAEMIIGATVVDFDKTNKLLMVTDERKEPHVFKLTYETRFENNGSKVGLEDIANQLKDGKRKVNVQHTAKNALLVQLVNKFEGTFVYASSTAKTVTMKLANGQTVTLPYKGTELSVEKYGKNNVTLNDVNNGDTIVAYFTDDQSTLSSLAVRQTLQFDIAYRDASGYRLRLRSSDSKVEDFYVGNAKIYDLNNKEIKIADLKDNDYVNVVMDGRSIVEVRQVQVTYGRVESVDTNNGTIRVRDNAGSLSVHQVGKNAQIQVDNSSSTSNLSALKEGDRVEVRKDTSDLSAVKLVSGMKRSFWRYNSNTNELYVKRTMAENNYIFKVHPNASIHSKGEKISLSSIKEDTDIMLYIIKDQVVEIEKVS